MNYFEYYRKAKRYLPRHQQVAIERLVRNMAPLKYPKSRKKFKEDYLKKLLKAKNYTYESLADEIKKKTGEEVSPDTISRLIRRCDQNSGYLEHIAEILGVSKTYLKTGIVYGTRKVNGREMKYIKEIHRHSTADRLLVGLTEKEYFEMLPERTQKALAHYVMELSTL